MAVSVKILLSNLWLLREGIVAKYWSSYVLIEWIILQSSKVFWNKGSSSCQPHLHLRFFNRYNLLIFYFLKRLLQLILHWYKVWLSSPKEPWWIIIRQILSKLLRRKVLFMEFLRVSHRLWLYNGACWLKEVLALRLIFTIKCLLLNFILIRKMNRRQIFIVINNSCRLNGDIFRGDLRQQAVLSLIVLNSNPIIKGIKVI
jgi:hypothetical protein